MFELNETLANTICAIIALGYIKNNPKLHFVYTEKDGKTEEQDKHKKLQELLQQKFNLTIICTKQNEKTPNPLVIAKTKYITAETEELIQDTVAHSALLTDLIANKEKTSSLKGAYIGGCIKPDTSIEFTGPSALKLYPRPTKDKEGWEIIGLENDKVKKSFEDAKDISDFLNIFLKENVYKDRYKIQNKTYFTYNPRYASETPASFMDNHLFGSVHGLVWAIINYNLTKSGVGSGKDQMCCELALSKDTDKVGSCIPCSIFATSNGTPPNYTHFGRGDNWNFPDTVKSEHGNYALTSKKNIWKDKVKSYFSCGLNMIGKNTMKAEVIASLRALELEKIPDIFLHSLNFQGKFIDKILNTLQ